MEFYLILDDLLYFQIKNTRVVMLKDSNFNNTKKTETKRTWLPEFIFRKQSDRLIQVKTIKSAFWDLRKDDRVRLIQVTV